MPPTEFWSGPIAKKTMLSCCWPFGPGPSLKKLCCPVVGPLVRASFWKIRSGPPATNDVIVFSIIPSFNNKLSILLSKMAKIVAKIKKRGLPLKFTANHLFPEAWPETDRDGQHRTPLQSSPEWAAIVDFRESESWKDGDLQMFADYFHVKHNSLSAKIIRTLEQRNTDSSRKALASIQGRRKRTKLGSLKDTPEVQAPPAPHAAEPPDRIPIVQLGVLAVPERRVAHSHPRAVRSVTPRASAPHAGNYASALHALAESDGALATMEKVLFTQPPERGTCECTQALPARTHSAHKHARVLLLVVVGGFALSRAEPALATRVCAPHCGASCGPAFQT